MKKSVGSWQLAVFSLILFILIYLIYVSQIQSTVELKTTDWLHEPVICIDSATGVPVTADSAHIHVFYGNADSSCYSARITTIPSSWIDRIVYAGATTPSFFFMDQVADIDADSGTGYYSVNAILWKDRTPTDNIFSFNLVDTTTQTYGSINYWKADSVAGAVTATNKANFKITNTAIWDKDISGYSGSKAGTYVKVLYDKKPANLFLSDDIWTDTKAGYLDVAISDLRDSLHVIDSVLTAYRDSLENAITVTNKANFKATEVTVSDTTNLSKLYIAGVDTVKNITYVIVDDTTNLSKLYIEGVDTIECYVDVRGFVVPADTTVSGNTISTFNVSSDSTHGYADMVKVSGDGTAADNLEDAFDGDTTSVGAKLTLGQLWIDASNLGGASHALYSLGSATSGYGAYIEGHGTAGHGLYLYAAGTGGCGLYSYGSGESGKGAIFSGNLYDINADIHGAIDRTTVADSATAVALGSADADTLAKIRDYAHAVQESINAHAPHGDDWSGATGSNWSDTQRDSLLAYIDSAYAHLDSFFATTFGGTSNWSNAQRDSLLNAILAANKANFKATGFATAGSVHTAITDANKANFKADVSDLSAIKAKTDQLSFTTKGVESAVQELDEDSATIDLNTTVVSASCAGSGLRTINIYVQNSADSSGLQSYEVSVIDSSSETDKGRISTDSDGLATFSLDDDTYEISFSAPSWEITSPVYLTVTASDDTTYYATQYSPTPPSATYCTVYTYTYKLTGAYSGCRLEARIPVEYGVVTSSTFLTVPYVVTDTSEADGKVELSLIRSTNLTSSTELTPVKVRLKLFDPDGNSVADTLMEVPDQASKKIW